MSHQSDPEVKPNPPDPVKLMGDLVNCVDQFVKEVETWAKERDRSVSTVCAQATGNTYVLDTMRRKVNRARQDMRDIRWWMEDFDESRAETGTSE